MTEDNHTDEGDYTRPITDGEWEAMQRELEGDGLTFQEQRDRQGALDDALVALVAQYGAGAVLLRMRAIYEVFPAAKAAAARRADPPAGERAGRATSDRPRRTDTGRGADRDADAPDDLWAVPKSKPKRAMTLQEARRLLGG